MTSYVPQLVSNCMYQLRPKISASRISVVSRVVNPQQDKLRPAVCEELYQLRPKMSASCVFVVSLVVNRTLMSYIERYEYAKYPTILRFLHSFIVRYYIHNYAHTCRIVERY